jgi:hypothetical protein
MELLLFGIGIIVAFITGAAGSALMILINDKKMAAVEKVKRRILYGPEKPLFAVDPGSLDMTIFNNMARNALSMESIIKSSLDSTAKEIEAKQREAIRKMSVTPPPSPDSTAQRTEALHRWLRENRSKNKL